MNHVPAFLFGTERFAQFINPSCRRRAMLDLMAINWLAVLVALVAHMILGAAWFGIFAKPWAALAHPGKSADDMRAGPKWIYGIAAGGGLITAIILAAVLRATGATTLGDALLTTFWLWVGFVVMKYATTYAFEHRSWTLLALDVGYPLVSMSAMAAIFALWP